MFTTRTLAALLATALTAAAAAAQSNAKPDLIIQDITFRANANDVRLKTRNVGNATADNFKVRLTIIARVDGSNQTKVLFDQSKSFGRIKAGATENEDFAVNFRNIQTQADAFKALVLARIDNTPGIPLGDKVRLKKRVLDHFVVQAVATADSDNQVAEANENNNKRTETFPAQ